MALWLVGSITGVLVAANPSTFVVGVLLVLLSGLTSGIGLSLPYLKLWRVGVSGVDLQMKNGLTPGLSLDQVRSSFWFFGTGARKLTQDKDRFEAALQRCTDNGTTVRLLLSRPDAENLKDAAVRVGKNQDEYTKGVVDSLRVIADLRQKSLKVDVRFYRGLTYFRLMYINDRLCVFSYNVYGTSDEQAFPQLFLSRNQGDGTKSFYWGFARYFEQQWEKAERWDYLKYL